MWRSGPILRILRVWRDAQVSACHGRVVAGLQAAVAIENSSKAKAEHELGIEIDTASQTRQELAAVQSLADRTRARNRDRSLVDAIRSMMQTMYAWGLTAKRSLIQKWRGGLELAKRLHGWVSYQNAAESARRLSTGLREAGQWIDAAQADKSAAEFSKRDQRQRERDANVDRLSDGFRTSSHDLERQLTSMGRGAEASTLARLRAWSQEPVVSWELLPEALLGVDRIYREMCEARRKVSEATASAPALAQDELLSPTRKAGRIDAVIADLALLEKRLQVVSKYSNNDYLTSIPSRSLLQVVQVLQMGMVEQEKELEAWDSLQKHHQATLQTMVADALGGLGQVIRALRMQSLGVEADTLDALRLGSFSEDAALGDICAQLRVSSRLLHGDSLEPHRKALSLAAGALEKVIQAKRVAVKLRAMLHSAYEGSTALMKRMAASNQTELSMAALQLRGGLFDPAAELEGKLAEAQETVVRLTHAGLHSDVALLEDVVLKVTRASHLRAEFGGIRSQIAEPAAGIATGASAGQ